MPAEAPAAKARVGKPERVDRRLQRPSLGLDRIERRVARIVRGPMARQIDGDEPEARPERAVELLGKRSRGRGVAVQKNDRGPPPGGLVDRDGAVRRVYFCAFPLTNPSEDTRRLARTR